MSKMYESAHLPFDRDQTIIGVSIDGHRNELVIDDPEGLANYFKYYDVTRSQLPASERRPREQLLLFDDDLPDPIKRTRVVAKNESGRLHLDAEILLDSEEYHGTDGVRSEFVRQFFVTDSETFVDHEHFLATRVHGSGQEAVFQSYNSYAAFNVTAHQNIALIALSNHGAAGPGRDLYDIRTQNVEAIMSDFLRLWLAAVSSVPTRALIVDPTTGEFSYDFRRQHFASPFHVPPILSNDRAQALEIQTDAKEHALIGLLGSYVTALQPEGQSIYDNDYTRELAELAAAANVAQSQLEAMVVTTVETIRRNADPHRPSSIARLVLEAMRHRLLTEVGKSKGY